MRGQNRLHSKWPLPYLPRPPPGPSPGPAWAAPTQASGIARTLAQRLPAAPYDAAPRPTARPRGPQLPSSPSCHWAPLSHHSRRRPLPQTSRRPAHLARNQWERRPTGDRCTVARIGPSPASSEAASGARAAAEGRGEISKLRKARGQHPGTWGVELRRALTFGLSGPVVMLKCGMSGSQVKGGAASLPFLRRKREKEVHGGGPPLSFFVPGVLMQRGRGRKSGHSQPRRHGPVGF